MGNRITTYSRLALLLCLCVAAGLSGCEQIQASHYHDFEDDNPTVRLAAITRAGNTCDEKSIPYLVERLTDSEADVRLFAIVALRKTTGETFGYRHYGSRRTTRLAKFFVPVLVTICKIRQVTTGTAFGTTLEINFRSLQLGRTATANNEMRWNLMILLDL